MLWIADWLGPDSFERVSVALLGAITALLIYLGKISADRKQEKREEPRRLEVAGALVDGRDARAWRDAVLENNEMLRMTIKAMDRCADATEENGKRVERATSHLQRMTDELIRSQRQ